MEPKTKVNAENGRQDLTITREFDLPVELLFKAYAEPEIIEQWMSNPYSTTKLMKFEGKDHGSYRMETTGPQGNVAFRANGVIHRFTENKKIIRTFEMEGTPYGVQLEVYEFEPLGEDSSRLNMHVIYESGTQRDEVLKLPFAQGINMAHNRIEEILGKK
ncbi:MAG: SRPBCC domain-containing protein [Bacteroidetes bacterium]|nr:SRPBCC domain-containing protein [Bacteroidota bacterium]